MSEDTLNKIYQSVGRLEGTVDGINNRLDRMNGTVANNTKRVNKNAGELNKIKGYALAIGGVAGLAVQPIMSILKKFF